MSGLKSHPTAFAAALVSLGAVFGATAHAAGGSTTGTASGATSTAASASASDMKAGSMAAADRRFVQKAAMAGMAEVELGQLAQQKASDDQVKQFGAHMVQDHGKANDELKQVASAKGLQLPTGLDGKHAKGMKKLQQLSGADFDREYATMMVADHKEVVSEFQKQAKSSKDADVKAFAEKTLPTLQEHLKMAQALNGSAKGKKKTGS